MGDNAVKLPVGRDRSALLAASTRRSAQKAAAAAK